MLLVHLSICWKVRSQYSQQAAVSSHDHLRSLLAESECGCLSLCEGNVRFCAVFLVFLSGTVACVHNFTRILRENWNCFYSCSNIFSKMCIKTSNFSKVHHYSRKMTTKNKRSMHYHYSLSSINNEHSPIRKPQCRSHLI